VFTGAGRAFSTGIDLTALANGRIEMDTFVRWESVMTAIERWTA
jgi:enoyl-CoA hydratase/carnithine racemase